MQSLGVQARSLNLRAHFGGAKHADALATFYFALFDGHPLDGGVEPTIGVGNYGRATVTNDGALWGTPAMGSLSVTNLADVVWPAASALWSITDPLNHWGIYDASTGGELWYISDELATPRIVANVGDQPRLLAGAIRIAQA